MSYLLRGPSPRKPRITVGALCESAAGGVAVVVPRELAADGGAVVARCESVAVDVSCESALGGFAVFARFGLVAGVGG
ncbi:hypothetical protein GCM10009828_027090 [Actinoplanes couchii]|uniref:Uncharacterized protein n=1 Tax=Actinoplanes couchii TaxID=403638 RepID=A0ABQ3XA19_9ACTN|nr:hypothetical protein Aco03nite_037130 [Actinoplanes couchii]